MFLNTNVNFVVIISDKVNGIQIPRYIESGDRSELDALRSKFPMKTQDDLLFVETQLENKQLVHSLVSIIWMFYLLNVCTWDGDFLPPYENYIDIDYSSL